jgi:amino acid transporter
VVAGYGFNLDAIFEANVAGPALVLLGIPKADGGYGSDLILKLLLLVVLLDIMAVGVGAAVASTRGTFAMARDRRLPATLAKVSTKYGTPTGAIVLLMIIQGLFIIASEGWTDLFELQGLPHFFALFIWASTFGGFALVVVYLMLSVGALRGLTDGAGRMGVVVAALVGIVITGAAIFGSFYKVPSPTLIAPWAAVIWFVIGLVVMLAVKGREPASQALEDLHA